jgi:hypothetical protein
MKVVLILTLIVYYSSGESAYWAKRSAYEREDGGYPPYPQPGTKGFNDDVHAPDARFRERGYDVHRSVPVYTSTSTTAAPDDFPIPIPVVVVSNHTTNNNNTWGN